MKSLPAYLIDLVFFLFLPVWITFAALEWYLHAFDLEHDCDYRMRPAQPSSGKPNRSDGA